MLAVKWFFEAVNKREICSQNSIFVQKFFASFLRQNFSLDILFLLVFVRLSGPKQPLDKKRQSGPETWSLDSSSKLHFLFCSHCLYQSLSQKHLCKVLETSARLRHGFEMSPLNRRRYFCASGEWLEISMEPGVCLLLKGRLCRAVACAGFYLFS